MTEPLNNKKPAISKLFIITGLLLLTVGILFGLAGSLQYLVPQFMKPYLSFEKTRPLHVSSIVFWIIFSATGSVLSYIKQYNGSEDRDSLLTRLQFILFSLSIIAIIISYSAGIFGGREYWEFPPLLALPIIGGWVLFLVNLIRSIDSFKKQPVYVWMWLTGAIFFLFTFIESYLWIFPYFRNNIINDMTIQWKSYGSMVGAWNMLIYGSGFFLMEKISGNKLYSYSKIAFALYFLGLFNLMFNWGHHIYTLPTARFIQYISYAVSMTELLILGRILYKWRASVSIAARHFHHISYRFLVAADVWILLTLLLAILMSVPAINLYTHGTHITVAHTMGATIGINSFLLLAIAFDLLHDPRKPLSFYSRRLNNCYWVINISLFVFWLSLIAAGVMKARWQMNEIRSPFSAMMTHLRPLFVLFFVSGAVMATGFIVIFYTLMKNLMIYHPDK